MSYYLSRKATDFVSPILYEVELKKFSEAKYLDADPRHNCDGTEEERSNLTPLLYEIPKGRA